MNRDLIFRLIKDGEIVGFELHKNGLIYHVHCLRDLECEDFFIMFQTVPTFYIPHDSKDQFTGLFDKNGVRIFEGDCDNLGNYVRYMNGAWFVTRCSIDWYLHQHSMTIAITGNIHTPKEQDNE